MQVGGHRFHNTLTPSSAVSTASTTSATNETPPWHLTRVFINQMKLPLVVYPETFARIAP